MTARTVARRLGFTLIEVMLALAILGMALVILVKSIATNATSAGAAFYLGIATDLARGKMYDLEEELLAEGFQDGEQEEEGDFSDEGYPGITWKATIEPAELPSYEKLVALSANTGPGAGSGSGADGEGGPGDKFGSSALGGMMSMFGGGGGDAADSAQGAQTGGFIQAQYTLIQNVLKASVRKITLTVSWSTGIHDEQVDFILYITDPAGMQKALPI